MGDLIARAVEHRRREIQEEIDKITDRIFSSCKVESHDVYESIHEAVRAGYDFALDMHLSGSQPVLDDDGYPVEEMGS